MRQARDEIDPIIYLHCPGPALSSPVEIHLLILAAVNPRKLVAWISA